MGGRAVGFCVTRSGETGGTMRRYEGWGVGRIALFPASGVAAGNCFVFRVEAALARCRYKTKIFSSGGNNSRPGPSTRSGQALRPHPSPPPSWGRGERVAGRLCCCGGGAWGEGSGDSLCFSFCRGVGTLQIQGEYSPRGSESRPALRHAQDRLCVPPRPSPTRAEGERREEERLGCCCRGGAWGEGSGRDGVRARGWWQGGHSSFDFPLRPRSGQAQDERGRLEPRAWSVAELPRPALPLWVPACAGTTKRGMGCAGLVGRGDSCIPACAGMGGGVRAMGFTPGLAETLEDITC